MVGRVEGGGELGARGRGPVDATASDVSLFLPTKMINRCLRSGRSTDTSLEVQV